MGVAFIAGEEIGSSYQRRVEEIESLIDPDGALPGVVFVPNLSVERPFGLTPPLETLILYDQTVVGDCSIKTNSVTGESWFTGIRRLEQFKDRGLGIATYRLAIISAIAEGLDFRTHRAGQTEEAKKRWEKFAEVGLARVIEEFRLDRLSLGKATYLGHYVIETAPSETH